MILNNRQRNSPNKTPQKKNPDILDSKIKFKNNNPNITA